MSDGRRDRGEALRSRLSKEEEKDRTGETAETSKTEETAEASSVKERTNVNMYLPDALIDELSIRYSELDAEFQRQYGRSMEKNRDYYPAVIEAGLTGKDVKDVLDLRD